MFSVVFACVNESKSLVLLFLSENAFSILFSKSLDPQKSFNHIEEDLQNPFKLQKQKPGI